MIKKQHMKVDRKLLSYTNGDIHSWLDITVKHLGSSHRHIRHGYKAIQMAKEVFGKNGARIALLHILVDIHYINRKTLQDIIKFS